MADNGHVIVGGGLAGAKTAEALRGEGYDGAIVLVAEEGEAPYERPPLSKDYLRGESARGEARVHPEGWYSENEIELRVASRATEIDLTRRRIALGDGDGVDYDRLVLATGAEPRRLGVPGAELEGVHYLRRLADADALADRLERGGRLVVVGAGWIGAEVAASARQKGLEVTLIERGKLPLERVLGPELGQVYGAIHRDHGIDLRLETQLERFVGEGRVEAVELGGGERIDCDLAVVGVGVLPRVELAEQAGLELQNGIVTDERLETSAPGVFAVGDVANAFHPFYGRRIRVEHWANALHQPETVARAVLGKEASHERLPYFFSDQYDVEMEYSGYATEWDEVVFRGDVEAREFIAFWLRGGAVVAGMNVNVWDVADPIQELIRSRAIVDVGRLRDPDAPLDELADGAASVRSR